MHIKAQKSKQYSSLYTHQ